MELDKSFSAIGNQIYEWSAGVGDFIAISKNGEKQKGKSKQKNPDPYARPGQKKQGRELKNKARTKANFKQRNGKRRGPQPLKHHTPGRDHRKYLLIFIFGSEMIYDLWENR